MGRKEEDMVNDVPEWVPNCKRCGKKMRDGTEMLMGWRFRCPVYYCSWILEEEWDEEKKCIRSRAK